MTPAEDPPIIEKDPKRIMITGQHNRYQVRRLTEKKAPKKRAVAQTPLFLSNKEKESKTERVLLEEYLSSVPTDIDGVHKTNIKNPFIVQEIERKGGSYKHQDVLKGRYDPSKCITVRGIVEALLKADLSCFYCKEPVFVFYEIVREKNQWTLDRIDNDQGHHADNVVIACLECNLKRRRTQQKAFLFTKQLKIVRQDHSAKDLEEEDFAPLFVNLLNKVEEEDSSR